MELGMVVGFDWMECEMCILICGVCKYMVVVMV